MISYKGKEYVEYDNAITLLEEKDKEIERLKEELKYTVPVVEHNKIITKHIKEKEQLHSIIKEVREYIKENEDYFYNYPLVSREHLLEILDKENNNEKGMLEAN